MPRRIHLIVSIAVPLMFVSALAPMRARAQTRASPAPPGNPFLEVASAPRPTQVRDEQVATRPPDPPREERANTATPPRDGAVAEPPPALDDAMRALDEVLSGDARDPIEGADRAEPRPQTAGIPSRAETAAAIESVMPSVRRCAADQAGAVVDLRIVFTSSGRVTTASVESRSARLSPAQRSCVARAARRARIAAFERARFVVSYPLRL